MYLRGKTVLHRQTVYKVGVGGGEQLLSITLSYHGQAATK